MPYSLQTTEARGAAAIAAARLHAPAAISIGVPVDLHGQAPLLDTVRATAEVLAAWILGTTQLTIIRGPVVSQATGLPTGTPNQGDTMQLHDDEKFGLSVDTKDAKGFETGDSVTWASDDNGAVVSLAVSADGRSCEVVAVAPGSAVITVTDDAAGLSATEAVDVVPAGTATIALVEGAVEKQ